MDIPIRACRCVPPRRRLKRLFPTLTTAQITRIAARGRRRAIAPGDVLVEVGDNVVPFFVLVFLADLLVQLTDKQLRDLFVVARIDRRSRKPGSTEPPATIDDWVTAFKYKRDEIVTTRCKS